MSAALCSLEALPASGVCLPTILVPWLVGAPLPSLPLLSHGVPSVCLCLCPDFPLLIRSLVFGFRAHSHPVQPHLNLMTSAETLFPIMLHPEGWGSGL